MAFCSHCDRPTLFELGEQKGILNRPDGVSDHYRLVTAQFPETGIVEYDSSLIPEPIARRHRDAQRSLRLGLWEQAISTARTAVQVMARREDVKHGTLYSEIEQLIDKRGQQLPELIRRIAHRIRDAGNEALHPDDPDWSPTEQEAVEAIALLEATIEWLYALPARLEETEKIAVTTDTESSTTEDQTSN